MTASLWTLFFSAFLASTLLPGGSEAVLAALVLSAPEEARHSWPALLAVATTGNTLGGMTSWGIGRVVGGTGWGTERVSSARARQALGQVRRYGAPVLVLSWIPVLGDPLCLAAGWLRVGWLPALVFIGLGKAARYLAILLILQPGLSVG